MEFPPGGSQFAGDILHVSLGPRCCSQLQVLEDSEGEMTGSGAEVVPRKPLGFLLSF